MPKSLPNPFPDIVPDEEWEVRQAKLRAIVTSGENGVADLAAAPRSGATTYTFLNRRPAVPKRRVGTRKK